WLMAPGLFRRQLDSAKWAWPMFLGMTVVSVIGLSVDLAVYARLERIGAFGDELVGLSFLGPGLIPIVAVVSIAFGGMSVFVALVWSLGAAQIRSHRQT